MTVHRMETIDLTLHILEPRISGEREQASASLLQTSFTLIIHVFWYHLMNPKVWRALLLIMFMIFCPYLIPAFADRPGEVYQSTGYRHANKLENFLTHLGGDTG